MVGVLGTVGLDHLVLAGVPADGEGDFDHVVAGLHQHEDGFDLFLSVPVGHAVLLHALEQVGLGHLARPVEVVLDHGEELGVECVRDVLQPVGDLVLDVGRRRRHWPRLLGCCQPPQRGGHQRPHTKHFLAARKTPLCPVDRRLSSAGREWWTGGGAGQSEPASERLSVFVVGRCEFVNCPLPACNLLTAQLFR